MKVPNHLYLADQGIRDEIDRSGRIDVLHLIRRVKSIGQLSTDRLLAHYLLRRRLSVVSQGRYVATVYQACEPGLCIFIIIQNGLFLTAQPLIPADTTQPEYWRSAVHMHIDTPWAYQVDFNKVITVEARVGIYRGHPPIPHGPRHPPCPPLPLAMLFSVFKQALCNGFPEPLVSN